MSARSGVTAGRGLKGHVQTTVSFPKFWLVPARAQAPIIGALLTYTVSRGSQGASTSGLLTAGALVPVFALTDFGRVTAWSSALSGRSARDLQRSILRSLRLPQSALLLAGLTIALWSRGQRQYQELEFVGWIAVASSVSVFLSVFERSMVMARRYRDLALCYLPGSMLSIALFWQCLSRASAMSTSVLLSALCFAIASPRLLAAVIETARESASSKDSAGIGMCDSPDDSPRVFLILQVVGLLSFNVDTLLARLIGNDVALVRLAIIARAFGPVLLIGSVLSSDIWPRLANDKSSFTTVGSKIATRIFRLSAVVSVLCSIAALAANSVLPNSARLTVFDVGVATIWYPMLAFGSALGQVLAARKMSSLVVRLGLIMCGVNIALSLALGMAWGAPGFIAGSIISYGAIVISPMWRIATLETPSGKLSDS